MTPHSQIAPRRASFCGCPLALSIDELARELGRDPGWARRAGRSPDDSI
jgi:hypothetical protein